MRKERNPEYDKRDLKFVHSCEKCSRTSHCSFKTSPEGPEEVCWQLIEGGTYNCESCIRYMKNGGCTFRCVFFKEIVIEAPPARTVLPMTGEREKRLMYTYCSKDHGKWETNRRDSNQDETNI